MLKAFALGFAGIAFGYATCGLLHWHETMEYFWYDRLVMGGTIVISFILSTLNWSS